MQELHIDDVQQLLVQLTDVNDVAGEETGLLPAGQKRADEYGLGHAHSDDESVLLNKNDAPFSNDPFLLVGQCVLPEGQNDELRAIHQHHCTAVLRIHADDRDVYVLHKTVLKQQQKTY